MSEKKNLSKERYEGFKRVSEDIESREGALGFSIERVHLHAELLAMSFSFDDPQDIRMEWGTYAHLLWSGDGTVQVSIHNKPCTTMSSDQYLEFINFQNTVIVLVREIVYRMKQVGQRVVNA